MLQVDTYVHLSFVNTANFGRLRLWGSIDPEIKPEKMGSPDAYLKLRCGVSSGEGNADKARDWQRTIREPVRSGMSIEEFCRQRRQKEGRF